MMLMCQYGKVKKEEDLQKSWGTPNIIRTYLENYQKVIVYYLLYC